MKRTNKKILTAIISVALCLVVITSCLMPVYAETDIADLLNTLTGAESGENINLSQSVSQWLNGLIQEDGRRNGGHQRHNTQNQKQGRLGLFQDFGLPNVCSMTFDLRPAVYPRLKTALWP